ncbi:uncharacterized protein LOC107046347 [Diachasma alloeum]|uniref:uncharacterized protein LOC107046347 n=1 Tax=Diachasma alloeum TaxID=454923 RepID=UPI0007384B41|nr:uncharacterized protein LOC107046347 [Diachasma alloeum]
MSASDGGEQCIGGLTEKSKIFQVGDNEDPIKPTGDPAQQTKPDLHQRYLVETITMTTVTERRIVREISEDSCRSSIGQIDTTSLLDSQSLSRSTQEDDVHHETEEEAQEIPSKPHEYNKDLPNSNELSLTFKLGNLSLVTNSRKPNSAVRQLFPDPRFISPPPVPAKAVSLSTDEGTDSDNSEAQRLLLTTESLRFFDSVKHSKLAGSRSDSSESDSASIKRTIERNALRRSLICNYDMTSKKKTLKSKDLTLEERIRRLTCVDQDGDNIGDSTSNFQANESQNSADLNLIPTSGDEQVLRSINNCLDNSSPLAHFHHHHQSAYPKITDLSSQKKMETMPDLGIGNGVNLMKDFKNTNSLKMNTDARKQFLSSFTPFSCVASTGIDSREDYYHISSVVHHRDSIGYNSDSSYSLEDIEVALRGEERNYKNTPGPPDVTKGTPTGTGPDPPDATADELLAFVEQDKTRTERLKRKYDTEEHQELSKNRDNNSTIDDEDDELNDYGFNARPAVRGIKPQFQSTPEIVRELRSQACPASLTNEPLVLSPPWCSYDPDNSEKNVIFGKESEELTGGHDNTIKRINTMQKQIDDIYQTIAETTVSVQETINRGSYLESTLPRMIPKGVDCRYDQQNEHFHDHRSEVYSTLPSKNKRPVVITNYPCGGIPIQNNKCYRTMYFVPYNGITDPTYQNIEKNIPPDSSANYIGHIERYPFRRSRSESERFQQPVQQLEQQSPRYYVEPSAAETPSFYPQPSLHFHLNHPDNFRIRPPGITMQTVQLQHHQHSSQYATYDIRSIPAYTIMVPSRADGCAYSKHPRRTALDGQTQTVSVTPMNTSIVVTGFSGNHGNASSSSSTSPVVSSPTKIQEQMNSCNGRREAPEGAARSRTHDFGIQSNGISDNIVNNFMEQPNHVSAPTTQNSVYYAMNV